MKRLTRCPHRIRLSVEDFKAKQLLRKVELLISAAELWLDDDAGRRRAEELLALCDDALANVDEALARAIEAEEAHLAAHPAVLVEIDELSAQAAYPPDASHTAEALADAADERLNEARTELEAVPGCQSNATIVSRCHELRARVADLRRRLRSTAGT